MFKRMFVVTSILISVTLIILLLISAASAANQHADQIDVTRVAESSALRSTLPDSQLKGQIPLAGEGPEECDRYTNHGEKLKCLNLVLLRETDNSLQLFSDSELDFFAPIQEARLISANDFAVDMISTTEPAVFMSVGMSRTAEAVAEYLGEDRSCNDDEDPFCLGPAYRPDGNMDGICQLKKGGPHELMIVENPSGEIPPHGKKPNNLYREWCAEVLGDNVGDDDGFCEYQGKGPTQYLEPCVKVTNVAAVDQQMGNFSEPRLVAIETALADSYTAMRAMNQQLLARMSQLQELQAAGDEFSLDGGPEVCLDMLQVSPSYLAPRPSYDELSDSLAASVIAGMLYNGCTPVAGTDIWGFNAGPICLAFAVAYATTEAIHVGLELTDDAITGSRVDNAARCLQYHHDYMKDRLQGVQDSLDQKVEWRRLHLAVVELQEKSDYLISVSEAGRPSFIMSQTVRVSEKNPLSFVSVNDYTTWSEVDGAAGLWLAHIDLPPSLSNAELFLFELSHTETYSNSSVLHSGFTLFDRAGTDTICTGQ